MPHGASRVAPLASLLVLSALAAPSAAGAQGIIARLPGLGPTSFSFTNTSIARFRGVNFDRNVHDDNFGSLTERLDFAMQAAPWRFYLRFDGFSPVNHDSSCTPTEADLCYLQHHPLSSPHQPLPKRR